MPQKADKSEQGPTVILSGLACLAIAAILGVVAWWLLSGFMAAREDLAKYASAPRRRGASGTVIMALLGGLSALGTLAFVAIGTKVLVQGMYRVVKPVIEKRDDDWWKDMPAPKS